MRKLICGSCDQPATAHGAEDGIVLRFGSSPLDVVKCYRDPLEIGSSTWYEEVPTAYRTRTLFTKDPEYIEALHVWDMGDAKPKTFARNYVGIEVNDYVIEDDQYELLSFDPSGTEAKSGSDLMMHRIAEDYDLFGHGADEDPYVSPTNEWERLDRWTDKARLNDGSLICTPTLEQHRSPQMGNANEVTISPKGKITPYVTEESSEDRNAYVEGNEGFLSVSLLDEVLTAKHHAHVLNLFREKHTGRLRVGSMRLISYDDGSIQAVCVNRNCLPNGEQAKSERIDPSTLTRAQMEEFVFAIIQHGNNHAAKWFREKVDETGQPTFYAIHRSGCDLSEDLTQTNNVCTYQGPEKTVLTTDDEVQFLLEHNSYCQDKRCACSDRLKELVPALGREHNKHVTMSPA